MVSSIFFLICFVTLLTKEDKGIRLMSCLCMSHILIENAMFFFFLYNPVYFDLSMYLSLCWALDTILLFLVGCVLTGAGKKLTAAVALPFFLCQVFILQYPSVFPDLFNFALNSSYTTFMESFIFVSALKDTSIKEWIQTSIIVFCVIAVHIVSP